MTNSTLIVSSTGALSKPSEEEINLIVPVPSERQNYTQYEKRGKKTSTTQLVKNIPGFLKEWKLFPVVWESILIPVR